jgi:hypothetical protein
MPQQPFLALITPLSQNYPDNSLPQPQPPFPQQPPPVDPGYGVPDYGWNRPTHPIYNPAHPDNSLPPIGGTPPPRPQPQPPYPDNSLPPHVDNTLPQPPGSQGPIYIWGGGNKPMPPIAFPPDTELPPAEGGNGESVEVEWKIGWSEQTGWVVVGIPTEPIPTPSK